MHCHGRYKAPVLVQGHANDRSDAGSSVGRQVGARRDRIGVHVIIDIRLVRAHQAAHCVTKIGEPIAPDDALHAIVVVAEQIEGVLVFQHARVSAAVDAEVLTEQPSRHLHDFGRIGK